ncbi:major facilitator superfamily domain-containing protein [Mortierella sp. GBAus27b]|nr:major facilitator superfamily domain-containing protein [Mortierella sp. GBAus27b]
MGIMPIFWASLCDYFGRRPIYLVSMMIFILGSLFAAISHNIWVFFVMRAIQAFGSSSVLAVGGGSLSDVFHSGERGSAFGLYYLGPLIAPMVGPIIGGVISDRAGWRSTMWLLLGAAVLAFLLVLLVLPETYRHHIDEVKTVEDDMPAEAASRSHIHSTHSDPTLVASKTSLRDSDRRSIRSARSGRSHIESAMEFIVPDFVPPQLLMEEDEESMAEASGSNTVEERNESTSVNTSNDKDASPSEKRHVVFPSDIDNEKAQEKKSSPSPQTRPTGPKHFNPLRPLLCLHQPTNALLVAFNALSLAAQFSMNNTLPISFHDLYNLDESTIGACFCVAGFGSVLGSLLGGRYSDYVMRRWLIKQSLKQQRDMRDREAAFGNTNTTTEKAVIDISMRAPPEIRLQSVWLGVFVLPLGLMLFGWSLQAKMSIAVPLVGIFCIGFGMMMVFSSTTTALVDANSDNNMATSAVACNSFARGVTGAIGGFTALPLLSAVGNGWMYTFWGFMTLVGSAGLVLMVVKAKSWRQKAADKALNQV